jgi:pimeloyl-ACP methyl ester carboxylesterase
MWDYLAEIGAGSALALHHREMVDTALAWQGHIKVYSRIWDQDFGALLTQVRCPLLLMCSEADVLWPVFDRAIALRPDARRVVLPGSNFQTDEAPGPVAEALARFIKDVA